MLRLLLLVATAALCVTCLVACQNNAAPGQLTLVQGTVTSADSGRPLAGALLEIQSYKAGLFGPVSYQPTGDSVRTDASGHYQLHFTNAKGLYYVVGLDVARRFWFVDAISSPSPVGPAGHPDLASLTLGSTNTVDFRPNELRTVAVRIRNRNTGYQRLDFNYQPLRGSNLDTLAYLRYYYLPPAGVKFRYYSVSPASAQVLVKDTLVALVVQNPASLAPDTVRASLTLGR